MPEHDTDICPVCLDETDTKCFTPCKHVFCDKCIFGVFQSDQPDVCPICRSPIKLSGIKLVETNEALVRKNEIVGSIYAQDSEVGLASFHFDSTEDCYMSNESPCCNHWPPLDNGLRPPLKMPFINISIDETQRIFRGEIIFSPTTWEGDVLWSHELCFSEDYDDIVSGHVTCFDVAGNVTERHLFGVDLIYKRMYEHELKKGAHNCAR